MSARGPVLALDQPGLDIASLDWMRPESSLPLMTKEVRAQELVGKQLCTAPPPHRVPTSR